MRFSCRPLEELWSQALVVPVYSPPDISSGVLVGLDGKLVGTLEGLLASGRWNGERGEKFLIATQNMIKSDKIILYGLGPLTELNEKLMDEEIHNIGNTIDKLGISDFGFNLPHPRGLNLEYPNLLGRALKSLIGLFTERHEYDSEYFLKIIVFVEENDLGLIDTVIDGLRRSFFNLSGFSIIYDQKPGSRAA